MLSKVKRSPRPVEVVEAALRLLTSDIFMKDKRTFSTFVCSMLGKGRCEQLHKYQLRYDNKSKRCLSSLSETWFHDSRFVLTTNKTPFYNVLSCRCYLLTHVVLMATWWGTEQMAPHILAWPAPAPAPAASSASASSKVVLWSQPN